MSSFNINGSVGLTKRLLTYVRPYLRMLIIGLISTFLFAMIDALSTYMLMPFINRGFIERDMAFIRWVPLVILLAFIFRGIVNFLSVYCIAWVGRTVVMDLRQQLFDHFQALPSYYYDQSSSGKLLSKLLYDVEQVSQAGTDAVTTLLQSICLVAGLIIVMFTISWKLTLLFFLTAPIILVIVQMTNRRVRRFSLDVQRMMGRVTEIAEENIEAYRDVRIYGAQQQQIEKFNKANQASRRADLKAFLAKAYSDSGVQIVAAFSLGSIIYLAINPQYPTFLSAGAFSAMVVSMVALLKPLKNFSKVNGIIQKGLAGAQSIFELFDSEIEKDHGKKNLISCKGAIEFQQVSFAYQDEIVLDQINLSIETGETIALVGRSGSGKTTLARLIPRFYDVIKGAILIDGIDIREIPLQNLRSQISIVSQNITLFNGSVRENVILGMNEVSDQRLYDAAKMAHALEFIESLPDGFDTIIGDNGVLLSGGQRQRIAISRAILKDAPILILDEATSSLDMHSEKYIQAALDAVMKNRTTIVIAHRLSTIENANRILVLEKGHIVEVGNHQDLLKKDSYYSHLYAAQFA